MITSIGRMLRLEEAFGTHTGHDEAATLVQRLLDALEPKPSEKNGQRRTEGSRARRAEPTGSE
jgi:hypothetical protein